MLTRIWKGRPRGLRELPADVRNCNLYQTGDFYLSKAELSLNGKWLRLQFEDHKGVLPVAHFWTLTGEGWLPSQPPTLQDLAPTPPTPSIEEEAQFDEFSPALAHQVDAGAQTIVGT